MPRYVELMSGRAAQAWAALIGRLDAWLQPERPATPAGLRRAFVVVTAITLPLAVPLSGAVRLHTHASFSSSLLLATLLCATGALATWPLVGAPENDSVLRVETLALGLLAAGLAWTSLYISAFDGLPALTGGDGGLALGRHAEFVLTGASSYQGMVSLIATTHWLERGLGIDRFTAYRSALYGVVVANAAFVAVAAAAVRCTTTSGTGRRWLVTALVAGLGYLPATRVLLPLHHYYQADGFWPQVFGLLPLFGAIVHYGLARRRLSRLIALGVWFVVCRYTYLLNLGDVALTSAVLVGWEALQCGSRARRVVACISGALLVVAVVIYVKLWPVLLLGGGGFTPPDAIAAAWGTLGLGALLIASPFLARASGAPLGERGARMLVASGLLGAAAGLGPLLFRAVGEPQTYYFLKYGYSGAIIAGSAALALVAHLVASTPALVRRWIATSSVVMASTMAWFVLSHAYGVYRPTYRERVKGHPPWRYLSPHGDRDVLDSIASTLRERGAQFGGFMTPRWPESSFTNFRFWTVESGNAFDSEKAFSGQVADRAGFCVFWYARAARGPLPSWREAPREAQETLARLEARRDRTCRVLRPKSDPTTQVTLCFACPQERSFEIPLDQPAVAVLTGFHSVEGSGAATARWTAGSEAKVLVRALELPTGARCVLRLMADAPSGFDLRYQGTALHGENGSYVLPASATGTKQDHEVEISSPTFVPSSRGDSKDNRTLGVMLRRMWISCDSDG